MSNITPKSIGATGGTVPTNGMSKEQKQNVDKQVTDGQKSTKRR